MEMNPLFARKFIEALDLANSVIFEVKENCIRAIDKPNQLVFQIGKDDDVVKLYDLTSLCSSNMVDSTQNPFTIPVALLLYRVARNMIHSPRVKLPTNPATIRMLLKNCIRLLPKEKYPQIVASAHYMFSDSLIPLSTDPTCPKLEDVYENIFKDRVRKDLNFRNVMNESKNDNADDNDVSDVNDDNNDDVEMTVKTLLLSKKCTYNHEKHTGSMFNEEEYEIQKSIEKRCRVAVMHIADGLNCLKYFDGVDFAGERQKESRNTEEFNMANPTTPIPMPYESVEKNHVDVCNVMKKCESINQLKKKKKHRNKDDVHISIGALLCKSHVETMPTWQHPPDVNDYRAWKQHLKILLYEKACLVYATLAEYEYSVERYGNALKHIKLVLESRVHLTNGSYENILMSYLLGRAGDCCFQIGRKWSLAEIYRKEYSNLDHFDVKMKNIMNEEQVQNCKELDFLPSCITTIDNVLNNSWMCYSKALELENRAVERDNLQRRLGNICNELGSYYMKKARETMSNADVSKTQIEALFAVSMTHLENGIKSFKIVNDNANLSLLYSNTGRLMRLMAHFYSVDNIPLDKIAKNFYNKALRNYQLALSALSYRRINPEIWDTVFYELSTTLFTLATLLQDYSPQNSLTNKSDLEREVTDYLCKALKYCDMETPSPKQPIYQYRAADIHHRLASLYHNTFRDLDKESSKRSKIVQLSHLHYERAVKLYFILELPAQFLRAQLERIALYEYLYQSSSGNINKIKYLQNALDLVFQCSPVLKILCNDTRSEVSFQFDDESYKSFQDDVSKHDCQIKNVCKRSVEVHTGVDERNIVHCESQQQNDSDQHFKCNEKCDEVTEECKMLELLESRALFILRSLTKRCTSSSTQPKFHDLTIKYKNMYTTLLKCGEDRNRRLHHLYEMASQGAN